MPAPLRKLRKRAGLLADYVKTQGAPPCQGDAPGMIALRAVADAPPAYSSGLKLSLLAPQMGQVQEDGTASHLVPGFTSLSGSPSAGS